MKTMNYIKIGIASSILSIAAGCTSFLEEDLKSSLAPDNTYTSSLGFEVGATGLYAIARSEYNTWGENGAFMHNGACAYEVLQISTDLCRMGTVRDGSLVPFAEMTLNPSTLFVGSYWNWAYNLIASANELLIYSEKNDNWDYPTDKQLYQAEARFFRAYAYRTLVYLYGDVPWVETIQKPFLLSFSRDPKIEVLGNIIKDLEFAKTYLPDNPDNVKEGKLTTWAARHLLSEMYLLRGAEGDYKLAEENAQDVIDCPYYSLMKSRFGNAKNDPGDYFSDMFVENNQNRSAGNTEGIWVMQFQYNTVGGGSGNCDFIELVCLGVKLICLIIDQVDIAVYRFTLHVGNDNGADGIAEHFLDSLEGLIKIGMLHIELVDEERLGFVHAGSKAISLLGADSYAVLGGNDQQHGLGSANALRNAGGEIEHTGGIQQVDLYTVPVKGGNGRADRYLALDLLGIEVAYGIAVCNFAQTVGCTGFEQQHLGKTGLTRAAVTC